MGAIGFKLQGLIRSNTILGLMLAYTHAGLVGAGPWICSTAGIVLVGVLSASLTLSGEVIWQFQASTTYLIAVSLILTGLWQFSVTRFISDRLFDQRVGMILPNFTGAALCTTIIAITVGIALIAYALHEQSLAYRAMMLAGFVILCNIWLAVSFLSGLKRYKPILSGFFVGYLLSATAAIALHRFGLEGLVLGFVAGQTVLLAMLLYGVYGTVKPERLIAFDFLFKGYRYPSLMLIGLQYNVGIWIDKLMFWYAHGTGQAVIGRLNASMIYDAPIFLGYLAIVPGMAAFLVRMENEFAPQCQAFYGAVREGGSLEQIQIARNGMVEALRGGLFDIIKVQAVASIVVFAAGKTLLEKLGLSTVYLPLLFVQVIAASLLMLFLATMDSLLYLDRRRSALALTAILAALNAALTSCTLALTPLYFGYGVAVALLLTVLIGMWLLDRRLNSLEFETYMLQ